MWDPDTKWVGNESGVAHSPNKLTVGALDFSINSDIQDLLDEPLFLPTECDFRMRLTNWFYSDFDADTVKSVDELMGLYYYSVGRSANFLINIGPNREGKLPKEDKESLLKFGAQLRKNFDASIACEVTAEEKKLTMTMEHQLVNHVVLSEEIDPNDEIEYFEIKVYPYYYGIPVTVYRGTTIGHKAICQFPTIRTEKVEVVFNKDKKVSAQLKYVPLY
jgi:alpha-L-fucosidase